MSTSITIAEATTGDPSSGNPVASHGGRSFLRSLIVGNYFYFFSAALMMFGCCLLMRDAEFDGKIFSHKLYPLLILQA